MCKFKYFIKSLKIFFVSLETKNRRTDLTTDYLVDTSSVYYKFKG